MINIVIVEDHAIVRRGLCHFLETEDGISVIGEADNGSDALRITEELKPDVLLLDMDLPDISGLDVIERLKAKGLQITILILTMHDGVDMANLAMKAGASGYVIKRGDPEELPKAIRKVAGGDIYISPVIRDMMIKNAFIPGEQKSGVSSLSRRETQVLIGVGNGQTIAEIADRLCISEGTVKTYKSRINEKLGLQKTADIVRFCIEHDLI